MQQESHRPGRVRQSQLVTPAATPVAAYTPPDAAQLLDPDQRDAVDRIIRALDANHRPATETAPSALNALLRTVAAAGA